MVNNKDLKGKIIKDKKVIEFVYDIQYNEEKETLRCMFHRNIEVDENVWQIEVWMFGTNNRNDVLYRWQYKMPKSEMSLQMVVAFGLQMLKLEMQNEVQIRSELDFSIGNILEGMKG